MEILLFLIGGRLYTWLEILWRGYSHWTMFILGGICFVIMGQLNEYPFAKKLSLPVLATVSSVFITLLEFIVGYVVNLKLGWQVWDYSDLPFNLMGQICLLYFVLWIPLSAAGIVLNDWIRYLFYLALHKYIPKMHIRKKPHYKYIDKFSV